MLTPCGQRGGGSKTAVFCGRPSWTAPNRFRCVATPKLGPFHWQGPSGLLHLRFPLPRERMIVGLINIFQFVTDLNEISMLLLSSRWGEFSAKIAGLSDANANCTPELVVSRLHDTNQSHCKAVAKLPYKPYSCSGNYPVGKLQRFTEYPYDFDQGFRRTNLQMNKKC